MSSDHSLPRWDMSSIYPSPDSAEFEEDFRSAVRSIDDLTDLFDRHGIARQDPGPLDEVTVRVFEAVIERYNTASRQAHTPGSYLYCLTASDSKNQRAQAKWSEFQSQASRLSQLSTRLTAWIGSLDIDALIERSPVARDHVFVLRKAKERSARLMSPAEETLVGELSTTGSMAWTTLYNSFTSQLVIPLEVDGSVQDLPMSAVRKLAYDADRDVRRRAYEAELAAWQQAAVPLVAALNSLGGERILLSQRRGWGSPLEAALSANNIDGQTLDALMEAVHEAFPDFRRYLSAKARALSLRTLAWYDINAPISASGRPWPFDVARRFIVEQFGAYSPRLRELAERAFGGSWIDAEPRPGKMDVSFCSWMRNGESRLIVNYRPVFYEVMILAHELGHAYHTLNLSHRTMLQHQTPLTLAESASAFCQTIIQQAGLEQADAQEQLVILDASLQFLLLLIVDTTTWFLFEKKLCEKRRQRALSLDELKELMLETQRQVYADGLDQDFLHPFTWAAWPHLFWESFYNFQYSFGTLFGMGLYVRYRDQPEAFKARYDDLLSSTGLASPAELVAPFGIDIRSPAFWRSSLDVIRADIDRFESLVSRSQ